ncbi:MAG: GTP cyclohydrolase I FolE [Bacteroidales bacterium]|nr:GTP cyclohydrolase I FolE [Bacteroidales bacterium]
MNNDDERLKDIAAHIQAILELLGEDTQREGLLKTPMRAAKALWFVTEGYRKDPDAVMRQAIFEYAGSQIVIVKDIEFYSMCEHHILPFFGKISIGYLPHGNMIGLSKLARLVNVYARRLQVQERLTREVCEAVSRTLHASGVIVICEGQHLCMKMRGVEKQDSSTVTMHYSGAFENDSDLRREFFAMLHSQGAS